MQARCDSGAHTDAAEQNEQSPCTGHEPVQVSAGTGEKYLFIEGLSAKARVGAPVLALLSCLGWRPGGSGSRTGGGCVHAC
jgi:hypothetical protein